MSVRSKVEEFIHGGLLISNNAGNFANTELPIISALVIFDLEDISFTTVCEIRLNDMNV